MNRREILAALATGAAATALPETGLDAAPRPDDAPPGPAPAAGACGAAAGWFPNVVLTSHENRRALFYNDLVRGKTVMINFMSIAGDAGNPVTANLAEVQRLLGERMGREVFFYSITLDPERDTPRALAAFAARHGAGPGWLFLTGEAAAIGVLRGRLFAHGGHHRPAAPAAAAGAVPAAPAVEDCAPGMVRYGNAALGLWGAAPARSDPRWLAARLSWVRPGTAAAAAGPPRRRGPAPLALALLLLSAGLAASRPGAAAAASASPPPAASLAAPPAPATPLPGAPSITAAPAAEAPPGEAPPAAAPAPSAAVTASRASRASWVWPAPRASQAPKASQAPRALQAPPPPGTPPPGTPPPGPPPPGAPPPCGPPPPPASPYLHPHPQPLPCPSTETAAGDTTTIVTGESLFAPSLPYIDPPGTNFLPTIYTDLFDSAGNEIPNTLPSTPSIAYNLLEGDPAVSPIDPISPTNDLARIFDDIARYAEARGSGRVVTKPLVLRAIRMGIDILEGNPVEYRAYSGLPLLHYDGPDKVKQVQPIQDRAGKVIGGEIHVHQVWYDNHIEADTSLLDVSLVQDVPWTIVYTVDVLDRGEDDFSPYVMYSDPPAAAGGKPVPLAGMDVAFFPMLDGTRTVFRVKMAPGKYYHLVYTWGWRWHAPRAQVMDDANTVVGDQTLVEWEVSVFGPSPRSSEKAKLYAIGKIGDLAPSKRMWKALRQALIAAERGDFGRLGALGREGRAAFEDWQDRTRLPRGVPLDKSTDMTLFYVDNTIYGEFADGNLRVFPRWQTRKTRYTATLYNGDYFPHAYMIVDFGGARGWENQFKSSVKDAGSGCWFTFGRNYWWPAFSTPVSVPQAVEQGGADHCAACGKAKIDITFNWDPARRLRFYQFDPTHHDVAIFSVH